jgi:hypothetical protein
VKKLIIIVTILSFLNLIGCYSSKIVGKDILPTDNQKKNINDLTIVTKKSERIELNEGTYNVINNTLYVNGLKPGANFMEQVNYNIALTDIEHLELSELNTLATVGITTLILAAITVGVILVIAENKWR